MLDNRYVATRIDVQPRCAVCARRACSLLTAHSRMHAATLASTAGEARVRP